MSMSVRFRPPAPNKINNLSLLWILQDYPAIINFLLTQTCQGLPSKKRGGKNGQKFYQRPDSKYYWMKWHYQGLSRRASTKTLNNKISVYGEKLVNEIFESLPNSINWCQVLHYNTLNPIILDYGQTPQNRISGCNLSTSRGNARLPVFKNNRDRRQFLLILGEMVKRHKWLCHGYCLMENHYG